jgi:ATP-dependent RNA helicase SUPV3L1/SUV3
VDDADHWREETRAVEDRLSDALHVQLTQRFVDRRTSVLMRRLKQRESLLATVTENGEVHVEDQFIGRLEGFRFLLDPTADADQARTLRSAALAALAPAFSLRADKFYNAPDTEIDVTEQGGLMWGEYAVGKLVAGADPLSPQVQPFVDEDAAPEIAEKVRRRLSHWIDRRIAALFQPLLALKADETLAGMARGIAFRLVEALGVIPRSEVAEEVKGLDQESRASLRKHGVRFGQYTVFLPLLLKPAPTRLRLVLWSLAENLPVFPESPPPGLVTVAALPDAPPGYYPRAGYRLAGERAIRIDMLERLADMIRNLDARAGFEAAPEMLSITGLSLEQFAKLMQGMGYVATEGTRPKRKPQAAASDPEPGVPAPDVPVPDRPDQPVPQPEEVPPPDAPQPDIPVPDQPDVPVPGPQELPPGPDLPEVPFSEPQDIPPLDPMASGENAPDEAEETEVFYLFTRPQRRRQERPARAERHERKPREEARAKPKPRRGEEHRQGKRQGDGARTPPPEREGQPAAAPRAPRQEKPIDPDNPFAALMALKLRS